MLALLGKAVLALLIGGIIGLAFGAAFHDNGESSSSNPKRNDIAGNEDDIMDDFIMPRDAMSIARGEDPLDPEAQWKSMTDPLDLFGDD
jgi:hypothetical protein